MSKPNRYAKITKNITELNDYVNFIEEKLKENPKYDFIKFVKSGKSGNGKFIYYDLSFTNENFKKNKSRKGLSPQGGIAFDANPVKASLRVPPEEYKKENGGTYLMSIKGSEVETKDVYLKTAKLFPTLVKLNKFICEAVKRVFSPEDEKKIRGFVQTSVKKETLNDNGITTKTTEKIDPLIWFKLPRCYIKNDNNEKDTRYNDAINLNAFDFSKTRDNTASFEEFSAKFKDLDKKQIDKLWPEKRKFMPIIDTVLHRLTGEELAELWNPDSEMFGTFSVGQLVVKDSEEFSYSLTVYGDCYFKFSEKRSEIDIERKETFLESLLEQENLTSDKENNNDNDNNNNDEEFDENEGEEFSE